MCKAPAAGTFPGEGEQQTAVSMVCPSGRTEAICQVVYSGSKTAPGAKFFRQRIGVFGFHADRNLIIRPKANALGAPAPDFAITLPHSGIHA